MKKFLILLLCLFTTDSFSSGIGNVSSAPCDNETLSKYTGTVNAEINWEPNTINLNWYDGDTKLTVANNSQTCVYDGTLTVPAQPTKPGYTFNGWKVIRVPGGFTELEYIESTGTQWIDTGVKFTGNTIEYELTYSMPALMGSQKTLFGAASGTEGLWTGIEHYYNFDGAGGGNPNNYSATYVGDASWQHPVPNALGTLHRYYLFIDKNNKSYEFKRNNNTYTGTFDTAPVSWVNIVIFAQNNGGIIKYNSSYQNYGFKITQDGNLVRNFIPARRNSDNVVGMYDSITNQFFTNAGTGAFIAGPAVQ